MNKEIKKIIASQKLPENGGVLRDKKSHKDYSALEILAGVAIKRPSFQEGYSVIKKYWFNMPRTHQKKQFSCVGRAWALYKQVLQKIDTGEETVLSSKSIYNPIAIPGVGSEVRRGGLRTVDYGVNKESSVPSDGTEAEVTASFNFEPYKNEAAFYKNRVVASINTQDLEKLADMIFLNHGIVSGFGSHALYFDEYGMLSDRKFIKSVNSYGDNADIYWFEGNVQGPLFSIWTAIDIKNYIDVPYSDELLFANLKYGDSGKEVGKLLNALDKLGWKLAVRRSDLFTYDDEVAELVMNFKLANVHTYWAARLWERYLFRGQGINARDREIINELVSKMVAQKARLPFR